jgi:outer membrane protein OmpA-like peptidoglycan-associated protein
MKFLKSVLLMAISMMMHFSVLSQNATEPDVIANNQYYVVIGAFAVHDNATNFVKHASSLQLPASYALNTDKNLYYVYVLRTDDRTKAVEEAQHIRSAENFTDTWVYHGQILDAHVIPDHGDDKITTVSLPAKESVEDKKTEDSVVSTVADSLRKPGVVDHQPVHASASIDEGEGKRFLFHVFRASDGETVDGDVDAIDVVRSRKIGSYKANMPVRVAENGNVTDVSFICEVFGYRRAQNTVNFQDPLAMDGVSQDSSQNIVVPFELVRLKKGDIAVMYHVYFFKDAAIMRPESNYEVNSLVEMLKENPKYKIKIHGHTNGSAYGKIVYMGKSDNFFSLSNTREGFGSAKELSEERARVIRNFLISTGIEKERMAIKAWGGKKPVQDKHSTKAQENVRVEIEILED